MSDWDNPPMRIEHHNWYSPRLGWDTGVAVFGHWGPPMLAFPTSHGDQWELQRQGLLDAIADFIDAGRVKVFCVGSNNHDSFLNKGAHPFHRSWRQRMFDEYIRNEVVPFVHTHCQSPGIPITTWGASLGAYHAVNTLLRYPHLVKRCYGFSGVYDLRRFMDGMYDDNFYFHNPIDYMAGMVDGWFLQQLDSCEIRLVTGSGPWEDSRPTYAFSSVLARKGIRHDVDDWGWKGGHDWPYWKEMIREYVRRW
jgi:esterase/lipase superfamily enzyme